MLSSCSFIQQPHQFCSIIIILIIVVVHCSLIFFFNIFEILKFENLPTALDSYSDYNYFDCIGSILQQKEFLLFEILLSISVYIRLQDKYIIFLQYLLSLPIIPPSLYYFLKTNKNIHTTSYHYNDSSYYSPKPNIFFYLG
jgi:hypothetical protein